MRHGLATVRLPLSADRRRKIAAFLDASGSFDVAARAVEGMATAYGRMKADGRGTYTLWNGLRPSNRDAYLDAAASVGAPPPTSTEPGPALLAARAAREDARRERAAREGSPS